MRIFDFFCKIKSSYFNNQPSSQTDIPSQQTTTPVQQPIPEHISSKIEFNAEKSPLEQVKKQTDIELDEEEFVRISTAGDENVCPMCSQFEGKFFLKADAPKLPLCPSCSCAYEYYLKYDLPTNAVISKRSSFVLPAECTSLFFKHQHQVFEEDNINKQIRLCESDLKNLPEFMAPYISAGFSAPAELACRDLLPKLYMRIGKWDKAERTIKLCIDANAYYPNDGSDELAYLKSYHNVATKTLLYISQHPRCLQRNIYNKLKYEGTEREQLKHFLRYSILITKEKSGNTNKLYAAKK